MSKVLASECPVTLQRTAESYSTAFFEQAMGLLGVGTCAEHRVYTEEEDTVP